jgi:hypothetical protein
MDWAFAEIIERSSYGVQLLSGDVGSGTAGTLFPELNGTGKLMMQLCGTMAERRYH